MAAGVRYPPGIAARGACVEVVTEVVNGSQETITLEMLSSFTLGGLTPFAPGDAEETLLLPPPGRLLVGGGAHEDTDAGGAGAGAPPGPAPAPTASAGIRSAACRCGSTSPSRRLRIPRRGGDLGCGADAWILLAAGGLPQGQRPPLSGGLADRECGHWMKRLYAGRVLHRPRAGADGVKPAARTRPCSAWWRNMRPAVEGSSRPASGICRLFLMNFCTTWGTPARNV